MTFETISLILALVLGLTYVISARVKKGAPLESYSSISYILPSWMFTTVTFLIGMLTAPMIFEKMPENFKFFGFLMVLGLGMVSATPYFHTENKPLHYIGGFGFCIFAMVIVGFLNPWMLLGWLPLLIYIVFKPKDKNLTFYAEAVAYIILFITLLL